MLTLEELQVGHEHVERYAAPRNVKTDVERFVRGARKLGRPRQPWALFTAGCMGAGKTHVIVRLDRDSLLPLPRFVRVDMDRIRALLPETAGYADFDKASAGQMTQRECGLIAEVVTEEALRRGLNLWVDSSLRDADWCALELPRIRRTYPHKLAIVHVTASWAKVVARVAKRGEQTGRTIPQDVLRRTFDRVPAAVTMLRPMVDEFVEIDNDARTPKLRAARDVRALLAVCGEVGGDCESRATAPMQ